MKRVIRCGLCGRKRRRILLLVTLGVTTAANGQSSRRYGLIDGLVTDQSLAPLGDATVSILGSSVNVATGRNGRFQVVRLAAGHYVLMIRRLGYYPVSALVEVAADDTARMSFTLEHVVALDTVVVSATRPAGLLAEFESRRRFGFGHFVTLEDIEKKKKSSFVADLLRPILSVDIAEKGHRQVAVNIRGGCAFQLFLDGIPLPKGTDLNDLPPPRDLVGIEIYSGPATIPPQYKRSDAGRGIILFWSKTGSDES